jgi:hypothetical protein
MFKYTDLNMANQLKITIDKKDYLIEDLSDDAKNQLNSINVVDQKIANLQQEVAIMQTAQNACARALTAALPQKTTMFSHHRLPCPWRLSPPPAVQCN